MFDSKSPSVKIASYIIMGFLTIIIIISFGMPDFMGRMGLDDSIAATVNGEKISRTDFLRFRDKYARRFQSDESGESSRNALQLMIVRKLELQLANELGLQISDERIKNLIHDLPMFKDETGRFRADYVKNYLRHYRQTLQEFHQEFKEELFIMMLMEMFKMGVSVTPDEVKTQNSIDSSRMQIQYCFISNDRLKDRLKTSVSVTDKEIDDEMKKNVTELQDPNTDRKRVKTKLMEAKLADGKRALVQSIDKLAAEGKSFSATVAVLGGDVRLSKEFQIGQPVSEMGDKGTVLYSLSESPVFMDEFMNIEVGRSSRSISTPEGIYVFTPIKKELKLMEPTGKDYTRVEEQIAGEKRQSVFNAVLVKFNERSKVVRNINLDDSKSPKKTGQKAPAGTVPNKKK